MTMHFRLCRPTCAWSVQSLPRFFLKHASSISSGNRSRKGKIENSLIIMDPLSLQPSNRQSLSFAMLQSNFFPGQSSLLHPRLAAR
jgi:hypothetical protein